MGFRKIGPLFTAKGDIHANSPRFRLYLEVTSFRLVVIICHQGKCSEDHNNNVFVGAARLRLLSCNGF